MPVGEGDAEAPVEFAPPEDLRPGQIGTLIDERANVIDVTATIVDLAGRGLPPDPGDPEGGLFSQARLEADRSGRRTGASCSPTSGTSSTRCSATANEVLVSELKTTFADRLHGVEHALYEDAMRERWFRARPDRSGPAGRPGRLAHRRRRAAHVRARPVDALGSPGSRWSSAALRCSYGDADARPDREGNGDGPADPGLPPGDRDGRDAMSRWAEEENVFTRYLPYAIVFGLTEKWAKAFADLGLEPDTSSWYVGPHPFTAVAFAIDRRVRGDHGRDPRVDAVLVRLERVRRRRVLRRWRGRGRRRLLVTGHRPWSSPKTPETSSGATGASLRADPRRDNLPHAGLPQALLGGVRRGTRAPPAGLRRGRGGAQVAAVAFERIGDILRFLGGTEVTDYLGPVGKPEARRRSPNDSGPDCSSGTTGARPNSADSPRTRLAPGAAGGRARARSRGRGGRGLERGRAVPRPPVAHGTSTSSRFPPSSGTRSGGRRRSSRRRPGR